MLPGGRSSEPAVHNRDWAAAKHVLESPCLQRVRIRRYCDFRNGILDVDALLVAAQSWSPAQQAMARLAADLYNGHGYTPLRWLMLYTSDEDFRRAVEALLLWRKLREQSP